MNTKVFTPIAAIAGLAFLAYKVSSPYVRYPALILAAYLSYTTAKYWQSKS